MSAPPGNNGRSEADSGSVNCCGHRRHVGDASEWVRNERRLSGDGALLEWPSAENSDMRIALIATASFDYCVEYAEMLTDSCEVLFCAPAKSLAGRAFIDPQVEVARFDWPRHRSPSNLAPDREAARPDQGVAAGYRAFSWREQHLAQSSTAALGAHAHRDYGSRHRTSPWRHRIASSAPCLHRPVRPSVRRHHRTWREPSSSRARKATDAGQSCVRLPAPGAHLLLRVSRSAIRWRERRTGSSAFSSSDESTSTKD